MSSKKLRNIKKNSGAIGARIRESRERKGLQQKELAGLVGVTPQYFNQVERGLHVPSNRILRKIGNILERRFEWLKTGEGEPHNRAERFLAKEAPALYGSPQKTIRLRYENTSGEMDVPAHLMPHERNRYRAYLIAGNCISGHHNVSVAGDTGEKNIDKLKDRTVIIETHRGHEIRIVREIEGGLILQPPQPGQDKPILLTSPNQIIGLVIFYQWAII